MQRTFLLKQKYTENLIKKLNKELKTVNQFLKNKDNYNNIHAYEILHNCSKIRLERFISDLESELKHLNKTLEKEKQ